MNTASDGGDYQGAALGQTMCLEKSQLLNWNYNPTTVLDNSQQQQQQEQHTDNATKELKDRALLIHTSRLAFLAIHEHQHRHARKEATTRYRKGIESAKAFETAHNISNFDYECPDTKYVVTPVGSGAGLGQSIRNGVLDTFLAALASDRVALIVSGTKVGPQNIRKPWTMASCPRRDMQCFFMPMTPCTITEAELVRAVPLSKEDIYAIGKSQNVSSKYNSTKVVITGPHKRYPATWNWEERIDIIMKTIESFVKREGGALSSDTKKRFGLDQETLQEVRDYLLRAKEEEPWLLEQVALVYMMRPNPTYQHRMNGLMGRIFPKDFDSETAIGLPIRSSDKCNSESECLSFDHYMQLAGEFKAKREAVAAAMGTQKNYSSIILTSESLPILQARHEYASKPDFPFRFFANDEDVTQGTGQPRQYHKMLAINVTADDIMMSTMAALRLQLMSESTVLNCCSNFHKMMIPFFKMGCGAAMQSYLECLSDNDNPDFRLCCAWSRTPFCREKKRKGNYGKRFDRGSDVMHPDLKKPIEI